MQRCAEMRRNEETGNGWSHTHMWWIKIRRGTLGARDPSPRPDHPARVPVTGSPHNFWR